MTIASTMCKFVNICVSYNNDNATCITEKDKTYCEKYREITKLFNWKND